MSLIKVSSNSKLGKHIGSFNLPAVSTCPGRTNECEKVCYATSGFFMFPKIKKIFNDNFNITESKDFVNIINEELKNPKLQIIRIHASGDFYSEDYINKWNEIIKANPNKKFWAYTRSWRIKNLISSLESLNKNPNLQLFASIDSESESENVPSFMRKAFLKQSFSDTPKSSAQCPNQKNKEITCAKCTFCFKEVKSKQDITFRIH